MMQTRLQHRIAKQPIYFACCALLVPPSLHVVQTLQLGTQLPIRDCVVGLQQIAHSAQLSFAIVQVQGVTSTIYMELSYGEKSMESIRCGDVAICLTLDLGEITMPVGELLNLKPGSKIAISLPSEKRYRLRSDRETIAEAQLITNGDRTALEIVAIPGAETEK